MPPAPPAPATPDDAGTPALPLPAAVLWDMDGTLVDTEPCWMAAERELVRRHGGTWGQEDAEAIVGMPLTVGAARLQAAGVDLPVPEIVERMLDHVIATLDDHADWQPGALDLLVALQEAGVPCALVTMSYRRLAEAVLQQAPAGAFTVLVTGDEVTHGKPHPEPFLAAAAALGVDVTACVAIERRGASCPGPQTAAAASARGVTPSARSTASTDTSGGSPPNAGHRLWCAHQPHSALVRGCHRPVSAAARMPAQIARTRRSVVTSSAGSGVCRSTTPSPRYTSWSIAGGRPFSRETTSA